MEPNFNAPVTEPTTPKKWWQQSRKVYLIVAAVVLLVVVVIAVVALGSNDKQAKQGTDTSSFYYKRAGYERLSSGVGDAQALNLKQTGAKPVVYRGTTVVQACNVVTMDDIRGAGLKTRAQTLDTGFFRKYLDGQGTGIVAPYSIAIAADDDDSNNCRYLVEADSVPSFEVEVYQIPYASLKGVDNEIARRFQASQAIEGLQTYKRSEEGTAGSTRTYYILRTNSAALMVVTDGIADETVQKLLSTAARNFTKQLQQPAGPPSLAFDSPLLKKQPIVACDALEASTVKAVFGAEASPVVSQSTATSVGVLTFENQLSDNYVSNTCRRHPVKTEADINSFTTKYVEVSTQTFMQEEAAKTDMQFAKTFNGNSEVVSDLGDEAFFSKDRAKTERMYVREGYVVFEVSISASKRTPLTKEQKISALTTVSKALVDRVKLQK